MPDNKRKLNILVIPAFFPFPPTHGGKICTYAFIDSLRDEHNFHLFLRLTEAGEAELAEAQKDEWHNVTFHTVQEYCPPPEISFRTKSLRAVKATARKIVNLAAGETDKSDASTNHINFIDRIISPSYSLDFINALIKVLRETRFDIVQIEYSPLLNLINVVPEGVKTVFLETESQYSVIKDFNNVDGSHKEYVNYLSENAKTQELAFMSKYDAIFTLNRADEENLKGFLPGKKIYTSAFPVLDKDVAEENQGDFAAAKIVFMGGEAHAPNKDAVYWFVKDILPLLKLNAEIKIYITGEWFPETIKIITSMSDKIVFTGFVEDIKGLLQNSISIVPVRIGGGGLRTKTIYAMASNSAVVTTSLASVGIVGKDEEAFLVADCAEDFAKAINAVLNDEKLYERLVKNGRNIIEKHYRQKVLAETRNKFYYEIANS